MYTKYQILNVELAGEFSKSRKLAKLDTLDVTDEVSSMGFKIAMPRPPFVEVTLGS